MKDACCTDNIKHAEDETTKKKKNENKFKLIFLTPPVFLLIRNNLVEHKIFRLK